MQQQQQPERIALRVADAAAAAGLSPASIWKLIKDGELPAFSAAGRRLIWRADLEEYLRREAAKPPRQLKPCPAHRANADVA